MAQRIDLDELWQRAIRRVASELERGGDFLSAKAVVESLAQLDCPFRFEDLLVGELSAEAMTAIIRAAQPRAAWTS